MARQPDVATYVAGLTHARKAEVERLRALILSAHPGISEQIKWNAPSFGIGGDDRVTMRLQPGNRVQFILHRGAKVKATNGFSFADASGMVRWLAPDRGEVTIADAAHLEERAADIQSLVARWIEATR